MVKPLVAYADSLISLNDDSLPSWICGTHVYTSNNEHLVVTVVVQNLFGTDTVLLIICKFSFNILRVGFKM